MSTIRYPVNRESLRVSPFNPLADLTPVRSAVEYLRQVRPSLTEIERARDCGAISPRMARAAVLLWDWSAVHFSSTRQDRAFDRLPRDVYLRRFQRANRLLSR